MVELEEIIKICRLEKQQRKKLKRYQVLLFEDTSKIIEDICCHHNIDRSTLLRHIITTCLSSTSR